VHWTQEERDEISKTFQGTDMKTVVTQALDRMFKVYPWTNRYFQKRTDFRSSIHAGIVVGALQDAVKHMDDVKTLFKDLSKKHADDLHVDPGSFHLLTDCIIVELAYLRKDCFTPHIQGIWDKFFEVVIDAISKQYH
nr:Chain B, HEMOGLOBIN [Mustelus griseus]1GCV_D Chain D, HEMOGLOBIN [Mustelus griseus]